MARSACQSISAHASYNSTITERMVNDKPKRYVFDSTYSTSKSNHIAEVLQAEFKLLREAYLPETLLAYIVSLQFAGNVLTRHFLVECMELSALIAVEGSDLLSVFIETGRMQELVDALAMASKTLLLVTSARQAPGSRSTSKKMRLKGYTQSLWNVKP